MQMKKPSGGMIAGLNIRAFESSYRPEDEGISFVYEMTIRTRDKTNFRKLAQSQMEMEEVHEFEITPC